MQQPTEAAVSMPEGGGENVGKVLLMGRMGAGKTSMRSIIFANYLARDAYRITYTVDVNMSRVRFLGNLVLSLWDCGGQDKFMEQYFQSQRDQIFKETEVLIFVFDVTSKDFKGDLDRFESCLEALRDLSENARIFCLIHKMDLLQEAQRENIF
jgi:Ras-related GTP-binding protein A/B